MMELLDSLEEVNEAIAELVGIETDQLGFNAIREQLEESVSTTSAQKDKYELASELQLHTFCAIGRS